MEFDKGQSLLIFVQIMDMTKKDPFIERVFNRMLGRIIVYLESLFTISFFCSFLHRVVAVVGSTQCSLLHFESLET